MKITQSQIKQIVETLLKEEGGLGGMATGLNAAPGAFGGHPEEDRPGNEDEVSTASADVRRFVKMLASMINTKTEYSQIVDDILKFLVTPSAAKATLADMDRAIKQYFEGDDSRAMSIFRREAADAAEEAETQTMPALELPDVPTDEKRPRRGLGQFVRKAVSKIPGLKSRLRITSDGKVHISQDLLGEIVTESLRAARQLNEEIAPITPDKEGADVMRIKQELERLLDQKQEYTASVPKLLDFVLTPENTGGTYNDMIAGVKAAFGDNSGQALQLFVDWYKKKKPPRDTSNDMHDWDMLNKLAQPARVRPSQGSPLDDFDRDNVRKA
jgi:hypothetical protein